MTHRTVIAADIAKNSFQCVQFTNDKQSSKNRAYSRRQFENLITRPKPMKLVMETCGGAQHWARVAKQHGHEVVLTSPRFVKGFRQGQKTDANDAVAIFEASRSSNLKASVQSSAERQALGTIQTVRDGFMSRKTKTSNAIRGHLMEFGFTFNKGFSNLKRFVPDILEDAENDLPMLARIAVGELWDEWLRATDKEVTTEPPLRWPIRT
jgi:transposase